MSIPRLSVPLAVLVLGTLISTLGDGVAMLAMVLDAASRGPTWWVTEVYFAEMIPPLLLAPLLGVFVDRTDARRVWLIAVLAQAVLFTVAAFTPAFHIRVLLIALANVFAVASSSASFKLLPSVAGETGVEKANSALSTVMSVAALAGPAAGGALFGLVGSSWLLGFNGVTFVLISLIVWLVVPAGADKRMSLSVNPFQGGLEGLRAMWRSPVLGPLLPILAAIVFATSIEGVAGVFYLREVTDSNALYGLLLSAWALGSIPGSLIGSWHRLSGRHLLMVLGGAFLVSSALLIEGLIPVALVIGVVFLIGGFGNGLHNVGVRNVIHHHIPAEMHGRAWAYFRVLVNACLALGYLAGTPGILVDARTAILGSGLLSLVTTVGAIWWFVSRRSARSTVEVHTGA